MKQSKLLKLVGIVTQLLLGWIIIAAVVLIAYGIGFLIFNVPNLVLIVTIIFCVIALSFLAYKMGKELIGNIE